MATDVLGFHTQKKKRIQFLVVFFWNAVSQCLWVTAGKIRLFYPQDLQETEETLFQWRSKFNRSPELTEWPVLLPISLSQQSPAHNRCWLFSLSKAQIQSCFLMSLLSCLSFPRFLQAPKPYQYRRMLAIGLRGWGWPSVWASGPSKSWTQVPQYFAFIIWVTLSVVFCTSPACPWGKGHFSYRSAVGENCILMLRDPTWAELRLLMCSCG